MLTTHPNTRVPIWRWVYPVALASMVVVASGRGQVAAPSIVNIDKLSHFLIFGLMASLVVRLLKDRLWWLAIVAVSVFGMGDEIRQSFTPGRYMEFADWVADTAGALVAVLLYANFSGYRRFLERSICFRRRDVWSESPAVPPVVTL